MCLVAEWKMIQKYSNDTKEIDEGGSIVWLTPEEALKKL